MPQQAQKTNRFWIGVASQDHVQQGVEWGIAQFCHGKRAPCARLRQGDWLLYYAPRKVFGQKEGLQAFTALGRVRDEQVYQVEMAPGFHPYRRRVEFASVKPLLIRPLLEQLSFTQGRKNWGMIFRYGLFEISQKDFQQIAQAMGQGDLLK